MRAELSRIKLIKTEFESKLLFENPLINDDAVKGSSDEFSENIMSYYKDLPLDKSFVCEIEFKDAVLFWMDEGELSRSINSQIENVLESDMLINLASEIAEFGEPNYFSDYREASGSRMRSGRLLRAFFHTLFTRHLHQYPRLYR